MMIAKLTICACTLLLAAGPEDQAKSPEVKKAPSVEATPQAEKPNGAQTAEASKDEKSKDEKSKDEKSKKDELLVIEANIVSYTNAARAKYGLPPLKVDHELMKTARRHCAWMTRSRRLTHTGLPVAENIAMGQRDSRMAVRDWMNSSGHRANILNRAYQRIGVAAYRTASGTIFWCQQFQR
ncbi:MAG: CAP domain-containing protein [Pirellulales bacterium]|nr:CAP domain-containing protein [Pirellulales bacterium]